MHTTAKIVAAASLLAASILLAPAANAAPILTEDSADALSSTCVVTGGELSWGVKESFRAYISGSIANGGWEVADGAEYNTPLFTWSSPSGEIDANTGEGSVTFPGSVHFSGHDGVLNLLIANPTIAFKGDGTASLLLDTRSNNAQGELVVDEQQAYLGKVEGLGSINPASGEAQIADAPTVLTADGSLAFSEFYSSGDELDPITVSLQFAPCASLGASGEDQAGDETVIAPAPAQAESGVPWLPIVLGGAALVVIVAAGGMLIAGRKKRD